MNCIFRLPVTCLRIHGRYHLSRVGTAKIVLRTCAIPLFTNLRSISTGSLGLLPLCALRRTSQLWIPLVRFTAARVPRSRQPRLGSILSRDVTGNNVLFSSGDIYGYLYDERSAQGRYHVTRDTQESGNDLRGYSSLYQRRQRRRESAVGWSSQRRANSQKGNEESSPSALGLSWWISEAEN